MKLTPDESSADLFPVSLTPFAPFLLVDEDEDATASVLADLNIFTKSSFLFFVQRAARRLAESLEREITMTRTEATSLDGTGKDTQLD